MSLHVEYHIVDGKSHFGGVPIHYIDSFVALPFRECYYLIPAFGYYPLILAFILSREGLTLVLGLTFSVGLRTHGLAPYTCNCLCLESALRHLLRILFGEICTPQTSLVLVSPFPFPVWPKQ